MKLGRKKVERNTINLARVVQSEQLSLNKAAKLLGVNRQTVVNWIREGVPEKEATKLTVFSKAQCPFRHRIGIDFELCDECLTHCQMNETCYKIYSTWYD
jgi:DNA-binding XRE family transcriptional regulator